MSLKQNIEKVLREEYSSVYCNNCSGLTDNDFPDSERILYDQCDDCHRKYMNWSIGVNSCTNVTDTILTLIQKEREERIEAAKQQLQLFLTYTQNYYSGGEMPTSEVQSHIDKIKQTITGGK